MISSLTNFFRDYLADEIGRLLDYETMSGFVQSPKFICYKTDKDELMDMLEHGAIIVPINRIENEENFKIHLGKVAGFREESKS